MSEVMLWDVDEKLSVRASKLRSFGIYPEQATLDAVKRFKVLGWYNANDYFYFGSFDDEELARSYLATIHARIEGWLGR